MMRAIVCDEWCAPSGLRLRDIAVPEPGDGQVRIRLHAAGLNFADTLMIAGKYQLRPQHPFVPGVEGAGVIDQCGASVDGFKPDDRVAAFVPFGAFAEYVVVDVGRVFHIPPAMSFEVGASFLVAYGTSHLGLRHRGRLESGETLLVHGAGGGVGLTAVEIGKRIGARVIATAGSPDKLALARDHGADECINYKSEDIRTRVKALTDGRGADVVYDPVGGDVFDASLRAIAWEGRLLVIGFAAGRIPQVPANHLLVKNCSTIGVFWGAYLDKDPSTARQSMDELMRWYGEGALVPHISFRFELERTADALATLLERRSTGRVVVVID
jgi:NADPH:quinone reductase